MSYGIKLTPAEYNQVSDWCEANHIDARIWNAEELLSDDPDTIEFETDTLSDFNKIRDFVQSIRPDDRGDAEIADEFDFRQCE